MRANPTAQFLALLTGAVIAGCAPSADSSDRSAGGYEGYDQVRAAPTIFDNEPEIYDQWVEVPDAERVDGAYAAKARSIEANGTWLHVQIAGEGPPLVLLNGGPGNTLHGFHPYFGVAENFAKVIYYDRRGQGLSEWDRGDGYTVSQSIEDLEGLRTALGLDRIFILGHSWGGFLALAYADRYPEHVSGLVLVGALTMMDGPDASDGARSRDYMTPEESTRIREIYSSGGRIVASHEDGLGVFELRRRVFNAYLNGDWQRQFYFKPSRERMAQVAVHEWRHGLNYNRDMARDTQNYDLTGRFLDGAVPVFVAEGKWDGAWGLGRAEAFRTEFPDARIVVYENSSHNPFRSEPVEFFGDLRDFMSAASGER